MILPIDEMLESINEKLKTAQSVIVQAFPGAGKTTRIPVSLTKLTDKKIIVLEPRRLAAKMSALWVASELNEEIGQTIGYQIRQEKKLSDKTKVIYITEGLFVRYILNPKFLSEIGCVVIDEFHERHIHSDIALAIVKTLQKYFKPDLKLVVMSATLSQEELSVYLPEAPLFLCEGTNYPVKMNWVSDSMAAYALDRLVYLTLEDILRRNKSNLHHILIFLPGNYEIDRCAVSLNAMAVEHNFSLLKLSGDIPQEIQKKVFEESSVRKVILSTNIAETSLTISGVGIVIDSGLVNQASQELWSGLSKLETKKISQASAIQRAGRAGRMQSGEVYRLYTQFDYNLRPRYEIPEIQRMDLSASLLEEKMIIQQIENKISQKIEFQWFAKPKDLQVESAKNLLYWLGFLDQEYNITSKGVAATEFGFHPRLCKIIIEARERNILGPALLLTSLLSEGPFFKKNCEVTVMNHSDLIYQIDLLIKMFNKIELSYNENQVINYTAAAKIQKTAVYLTKIYNLSIQSLYKNFNYDELSILLIQAYPDRVAKIKKDTNGEYLLCLGNQASLSKQSSVADEDFIVITDADSKGDASVKIRLCHGISKELLMAYGPSEFLNESDDVFWDKNKLAVKSTRRTFYKKILCSENIIQAAEKDVENILYQELKASWPKPFNEILYLDYYKRRKEIYTQYFSSNDVNLPDLDIQSVDFNYLLLFICEHKKSFPEILEKNLHEYVESYLDFAELKKLNEKVPVNIILGKNKTIPIIYEDNTTPYIKARIQDFYGTAQSPQICVGKLPLTIRFLAPNNYEEVQVTNDLNGFWKNSYPAIKKELGRRYPRHYWPEEPETAIPELLLKNITGVAHKKKY